MVCHKCPAGVDCPQGTTWETLPCPAGQYKNDNYEFALCEIGYYCPGDGARHTCSEYAYPDGLNSYNAPYYSDEPGLSECKACPTLDDAGVSSAFRYWYWASDDPVQRELHTDRHFCRASWNITLLNGYEIPFSCNYGQNGYTTDGECSADVFSDVWNVCNAGYYLDTSRAPITGIDENGRFNVKNYETMLTGQFCYTVGYGYWSGDGNWQRTACDTGYYTSTDTGTSPDSCKQLCVGATKLHAGENAFRVWTNGECSSPAIKLGVPGGVCCVNLEKGRGNGLNVEYNGNIYHAND